MSFISGLALLRPCVIVDFDLGDLPRLPPRHRDVVARRARHRHDLDARALRRYPLGVRQQSHLARVLDGVGNVALLLHRVACDPAVADLGTIAHEPGQQVDVLVVDVVNLVG